MNKHERLKAYAPHSHILNQYFMQFWPHHKTWRLKSWKYIQNILHAYRFEGSNILSTLQFYLNTCHGTRTWNEVTVLNLHYSFFFATFRIVHSFFFCGNFFCDKIADILYTVANFYYLIRNFTFPNLRSHPDSTSILW